jgi:GNAT superfamily N-acetyltransferase
MEKIELILSKDKRKFKTLISGLYKDFGEPFSDTIELWLSEGPDDYEFWEVYLIYLNGKIIGLCGLYSQYEKSDKKELWLGWFGILKKHRSSGIGAKVLKLLEARAREFGCSVLISYVNREGKPLNFYYSNGFKRVCSVGEYLSKHPDLDMDDFENEDDHIITKRI